MHPPPFDLTSAELQRQDRWLRALVRQLAVPGDVDDVVQDTWVAALRTRPVVARPRAWLAVSAANFARRARRAVERRAWREREAARPEALPSSQESMALLELQEDVLRAVRELREPYQRAVLLRYTHGLSVAEIAQETSSAEAAVRQRLKRGLDQLREALGQRRGEDWRNTPALMAWLTPGALEMQRNTGLVLIVGVLVSTALVVALSDWPSGAAHSAAPEVAKLATPDEGEPPTSQPDTDELTPERRRAPVAERAPTPPPTVATAAEVTGRVLALRTGTPLNGVGVATFPSWTLEVPSAGLARPELLATTDGDGTFTLAPDVAPVGLVTDPAWVPVGVAGTSSGAESALLLVAPAITWRGVVLGPDGAALSGVSIAVEGVDLRDHREALTRVQLTRWLPSTTDAAGAFERRDLPAGLGRVRFAKEGYLALEVPLGAHDELALSLTLALDEVEYVVTGHVLAPNGAPVPGARVGIGDRVVTAALDGSYEHHIPGESAPKSWEKLWAAAPPYETVVVNQFGAELLADEDRTVTRELTFRGEALQLGGRVVDAAGEPVANCEVYIWNQDGLLGMQSAEELALPEEGETLDLHGAQLRVWSRTDEEGRFLLSGLRDAEYMLRVRNEERTAGWTSSPIRAGTRDALLKLPPDFVRDEVTGRVVDRSGRPVADAVLTPMVGVVIIDPSGWSESDGRTFRTDEEGRFTLRSVSGGVLSVQVNGAGIMPMQHHLKDGDPIVDVEIVVGRLCEFQLELTGERAGASSLQVLDASGRPLEVWQFGGGEYSGSISHAIKDARTPVLSVADSAATLVLMRRGLAELTRMPIVLRPGEVNSIRW